MSINRQLAKTLPMRVELKNLILVFVNNFGLVLPVECLREEFLESQAQRVRIYFKGPAKQISHAGTIVDTSQREHKNFEIIIVAAGTIPHQKVMTVGQEVTLMNMFHIHPTLTEAHLGVVEEVYWDLDEDSTGGQTEQ